jgi:transcriptional regulator with XRE-family HTH domain
VPGDARFAAELKALREASGYSWREMAGALAVSRRTLESWYQERAAPPDYTKSSILKEFREAAKKDFSQRLAALEKD